MAQIQSPPHLYVLIGFQQGQNSFKKAENEAKSGLKWVKIATKRVNMGQNEPNWVWKEVTYLLTGRKWG